MSLNPELHKRLISRQPDAELERKAGKAWMRNGKMWTREELDLAARKADELSAFFLDLERKQQPLGSEFSDILHANLEELYLR